MNTQEISSNIVVAEDKAPLVCMRHPTGFDLFRNEEQKRMKDDPEFPSNLMTQMPLIASSWKSMPDDLRNAYKKQAKESAMIPTKPRRKRKKITTESTPVDGSKVVLKKRKKRNPDLPKRPKSSYIFFSCERRVSLSEENPDLKPKQVLQAIGAEWRTKTKTQKLTYENMSQQDKERYTNEMSLLARTVHAWRMPSRIFTSRSIMPRRCG